MAALLGLDTLLAQLITAIGLALVGGNGLAILNHARGRVPANVQGEFRAGRARFLLAVGVLISIWGIGSLIAG